jgi:hypothetical protein
MSWLRYPKSSLSTPTKRQSSDILGDRRYAAREDATEREFDRYGQSTLSFFRHTWLCGTMGPTSRVEEY